MRWGEAMCFARVVVLQCVDTCVVVHPIVTDSVHKAHQTLFENLCVCFLNVGAHFVGDIQPLRVFHCHPHVEKLQNVLGLDGELTNVL